MQAQRAEPGLRVQPVAAFRAGVAFGGVALREEPGSFAHGEGEELGEVRAGEFREARGGGEHDLGIAAAHAGEDAPGRGGGGDRKQRHRIARGEPGEFLFVIALDDRLDGRAGAHEARENGGDLHALRAQLGMQRGGKPGQRELGRAIGGHVGHRNFAADGADVDDAAAAVLRETAAARAARR